MLEPYSIPKYNEEYALQISRNLTHIFSRRRTIRHFSEEKPDLEILTNAIDVARLSPSGANKQPWSFALIESQDLKQEIRRLSEVEEHRFYVEKPNQKWIQDLKHIHCKKEKDFITQCPYLIVIFFRHFDNEENGEKSTNYYAKESAGIATGMLISALHMSGLSSLTYTPKRMQFLSKLLNRPENERPFMVLGVGKPHPQAEVPVLSKKSLEEVIEIYL